jgi:hypothetical protein
MYYSYVEIEYVATSFSPARTDLALKLLRRLEEYYFSFEGDGDFRSDWNKYGKYFGTPSMLKAVPLANLHMAQASEHRIPVTHVNYSSETVLCPILWGINLSHIYAREVR